MLSVYRNAIGELITQFEATIDHKAGDGMMVFLNDPVEIDNPIKLGAELAMAMRAKVSELIGSWSAIGYDLGFGIGMSYGYATIGLIGEKDRSDYSATGHHVNLASRLCDTAEDGQILITKRMYSELEPSIACDFLEKKEIKGFSNLIDIYNIN